MTLQAQVDRCKLLEPECGVKVPQRIYSINWYLWVVPPNLLEIEIFELQYIFRLVQGHQY